MRCILHRQAKKISTTPTLTAHNPDLYNVTILFPAHATAAASSHCPAILSGRNPHASTDPTRKPHRGTAHDLPRTPSRRLTAHHFVHAAAMTYRSYLAYLAYLAYRALFAHAAGWYPKFEPLPKNADRPLIPRFAIWAPVPKEPALSLS